MSAPKVSVILCGYNQAPFLKQAIASVLEQTYENIELVAVDNGSTDGSQDLLRELAKDHRVRLMLHAENAAVTKRFNQAIAACSGELVSMLYVDDYYLPEKTAAQVKAFASLGADYGVVYSPGYILNERTGEKWLDETIRENGLVLKAMLDAYPYFISTLSPLVRKECFLRYPFREEVFIQGENIFLWIAMRYRFLHLDEPCVVLRDRPGGAAKAIKRSSANNLLLLQMLADHPDFPAAVRPALDHYRARLFRNYGWQGVRVAEDPAWARDCYRKAIGFEPRQAVHPRTLAGLALSMLPRPLLSLANRTAARFQSGRQNAVYKENF